MRTISRNYAIPIVTITQNTRVSENPDQELSNTLLGDSIKKLRYADYIYMIRQRAELDISSEEVRHQITTNNENISFDMMSEDDDFIPFEVKITKAKDGNKDQHRFHVFDGANLRIHQSVQSLLTENKKCKEHRKEFQKKLKLLDVDSVEFPDSIDTEGGLAKNSLI